jgi:hypothetical protein
MAQMNIVNVSTIYGNTTGMAVTTVPTAIVTNASSSGAVYKINTLVVSNISGTGTASINVDVYKNQSSAYRIAYQVPVAANTSFSPIDKGLILYLQENDSIRLTSSANGYMEAVCSYEAIS